jgi:adenosylmethionine-8-amino-7-oxononanoate aminotransferase
VTDTRNRFWHPFSDMSRVAGHEMLLDRAEGVWVWDAAGRRYYDATASLWYCNIGHGRAELAEAAAAQLRKLDAYSAFGNYVTRPALELAERVCVLSRIPDAAAFFTTGGSDAVDTAAKLVRRYWHAVGRPERNMILVREGAYHGMNTYGTSLAGIPANAAGYGDLVGGVVTVSRSDPADLARTLDEFGAQAAAFFGEPVIGAGGVYPPADGYWPEVQKLCRAHDVLVVADEVITGFGRLGTWFGSERYQIAPDIIIGAKGITSGYFPLGVVVCGGRIREPFWNGAAGMLRHGYTYSGHATAAAVALANLDIIEDEGLVGRVAELEPALEMSLAPLADHPLVGAVRTAGLLCAVELDAAATSADPDLMDRVLAEVHERGVLTRALVGRALQVSPPFVTTAAELTDLASTLRASLDAAAARLAPGAPPVRAS